MTSQNKAGTETDGDPIELLRNRGPKSSEWTRHAGITSIAELKRLGPVVASQIVKQRQPKTSLNLLWALAAGLKGQDWRKLTAEPKERLREDGKTTE